MSLTMTNCFCCHAILHPPYVRCVECVFSLLNSKAECKLAQSRLNRPNCEDQVGNGSEEGLDVCEMFEDTKMHPDEYRDDVTLENALICLGCFSTGRSNAIHSAIHQYEIVREDFPVIPGSTWTAKEELALLESIESCGLGSWQDIAKYIPCRTAKECEKHYLKTFISGGISYFPESRDLPDVFSSFAPYRNTVCSLPPRPSISSSAYNDISGYMAARGEFATEYDNYAELIVTDIEFSTHQEGFGDWYEELKLAMVEIYRYRVYERERRKRCEKDNLPLLIYNGCVRAIITNLVNSSWSKKRIFLGIVRDHGLLNVHASALYFIGLTKRFSQATVELLRKCMRLMDAEEFLKYVESLKTEVRLRQRITRLCEYRSDGITKLHQIKLFEKLKNRRLETKRKRTSLTNCITVLQDQETWKRYTLNSTVADKIASGGAVPHPALSRKKAGPLEINGLPGYERLGNDEKELCAVARLVPSAFIDFKAILINDCKKDGFLRLAKARTLIKIDVNKTRKIYDFLVQKELINKEPL